MPGPEWLLSTLAETRIEGAMRAGKGRAVQRDALDQLKIGVLA